MNKPGMILTLVMGLILYSFSNVYGQYSGGSGTEADPYKIASAVDLMTLGARAGDYGKVFILVADIDLTGQSFTQSVIAPDTDIGSGFQGTAFSGVFDGNYYKIKNLTIIGGRNKYVGLFGKLMSSGLVKNLGLENISIVSDDYTGGLCGINYGNIIRCYAKGIVSGILYVGGLCGYNSNGTISLCYAMCNVSSNSNAIGGLCGENSGTINLSYATGAVTGYGRIGGLCGNNYQGQVIQCYAAGSLTGITNTGGVCGENDRGTISECYWDINTTGKSFSAGGWGKTTEQMKQASTYMGWNNGKWTLLEGIDYPHFAWENSVGIVINTEYPVPSYHGSGTMIDPYQIATVEDILCLSWRKPDWSKCFVMTADIDLAGNKFIHAFIANSDYFTGVFDGNGHLIKNLTITNEQQDYLGMFYRIGSGGQVKNVGLVNIMVQGNLYIGGLSGYNDGGIITQCFVTGEVLGNDKVGGLCGYNKLGSLIQCYSNVSVKGNGSPAGLCESNGGVINQCYAAGTVTRSGDYPYSVGGLCANNSGTITASFWDTQTSGQTSSSGGTGKSTNDMQTQSTFLVAGWDFVDTDGDKADWKMPKSNYPALNWENHTVVPNVIGLPQSVATNLLADASFNVIITEAFNESVTAGFVVEQTPVNGTEIRNGSIVKLILSLGSRYSNGSGTELDPYHICTPSNWKNLIATTLDWNKHFILLNDIDLNEHDILPVGNSTTKFTGVFNGNNHIISNISVAVSGNDYIGLFGQIGSGGQVKNLGLENVNIKGRSYIGGLCGWNSGGSISSCYVTGIVVGETSYAGGLCGRNDTGSISQCYTSVNMSGSQYVGGLCGRNYNNGSINVCYSIGKVAGNSLVGGLCGSNNSTVRGCFWDMETSGLSNSAGGIGNTTSQMQNIQTFLDAGWDFIDTDGDVADWIMAGYPKMAMFVTTPQIGLSSDNLYSNGQAVSVDIFNEGIDTLNWQITGVEECGWIANLTPPSGNSIGYNDRTAVWIEFDLAGLDKGSYQCELTISDCNNPTISRILTITLKTPVGMDELALLSSYWLVQDCGIEQSCAQVDWYQDQSIDLRDLWQLIDNWLENEIEINVPILLDGFESGDLNGFDWQTGGNANWLASEDNTAYAGGYSARSGTIYDGGISALELSMDTTGKPYDTIRFVRKVSSESGYDYLKFYIDGVMKGSWAGELDWLLIEYPLSSGLHTYRWEYSKDPQCCRMGADGAWIDNVEILKK